MKFLFNKCIRRESVVAVLFKTRGGRTSSKKHVKKLHSILRYAESSRGFTEIKQVSARSIQVSRGSMGFNAWNTFVLRLHCQKVGEIPGYG